MGAHNGAFDWEDYWRTTPPSPQLVSGARRMAARLRRFVRLRSVRLDSFADMGCGPAIMLSDLARRLRRCEFHGFDSSPAVLRMDRQRARRERHPNLHFGYARLPRTPSATFDMVTCFATLHYVRDINQAVRNLYDAVNPGGYLIFNYPNRMQQAAYRRDARTDPSVKRRFQLVLSGRNLLTASTIVRIVGRKPENFWSAVGEPARRSNPCVAVAK